MGTERRDKTGIFWYLGPVLASVLSLLIAGASLYFSFKNQSTTEQINLLNVEPDIEYWYSYEGGLKDKFMVRNNGPIRITNLSVTHRTYTYNVEKGRWTSLSTSGHPVMNPLGRNWIFQEQLQVNEPLIRETGSSPQSHTGREIIGQEFEITFYRENDMKLFSKHVTFLIHKGSVYTPGENIDDETVRDALDTFNGFIERSMENLTKAHNTGNTLKKFRY